MAPHFVVAIINDTTILRCVLSAGAATIVSEPARLTRNEQATGGVPPGFVRVLVYSPNLVTDEYPSFAWDADLDIDGAVFYIGSVEKRCEVLEKRFMLPTAPRTVQLRLHRLRLAPVRSAESESLAQRTLALLQDGAFNPRGGSLPLRSIAEEMQKRHPAEYRAAVGGEHLGSFRAFIEAHGTRFSIFHYHESEIESRKMSNVSPFDERVAIRKGVRESLPPLMPLKNNEDEVISLIRDALRDCDSHVHVLIRQLSSHEVFRVSMAAGFSSLMHWLQKHRDHFCWSTDPTSVCIIGLVRDKKKVAEQRAAQRAELEDPDDDDDRNEAEKSDDLRRRYAGPSTP